jgi:hypothetical protein
MNILQLDEAQGLTAEMVRAYLRAQGPRVVLDGEYWVWPSKSCVRDKYFGNRPSERLTDIAFCEGIGAQELLRRVNPRMRKGTPSQEAIEVHGHNGGVWIGSYGVLGDGGFIVFVSFRSEPSDNPDHGPLHIWDDEEWHDSEWRPEQIKNYWSFWPCDANGNKVRWYEKDGVML